MKPWSLIVTFVLTLAVCGSSAQAQQLINKNINVDGLNRSYLVYLPTNFDPAEYMPAMFHFHGGGGTANGGLSECDYRSLANAERFIAVYPQATDSTAGTNCWDCLGDYHGGIDEMGFMSAMIDALAADYNIDTQRVYASGYSLGGSIVYDFAAYLPDRVAVIAPTAANMWEWTLSDVNWSTSVACVHLLGTNDFYAPYNGNEYSISTSAQNAHFVGLNGAETTPTSENLGGNITRYTWAAGEGCHGHQHYVRQGGGHDAPSGYPSGPEWIWDYASQYSLDGIIECAGGCDGDFNGDGTRDVNDILTAISAFGNGDGGDVDGDGDTDVSDILELLSVFGQDC
jgi:polyhydroxybutyrate depolymerase